MDMGDKDKFELENRNGDLMNYAASMSDWRFGTANLTSRSLGLVPTGNLMAVSKGDLIGSSSCSSTSMVESFGQTLWGHNSNSENLGFYDINGPNNASTSERMGKTKADPVSLISIERSSDMGWNQTSPTLKGGIFLPNAAAMPPQSLSQFPADSGFIERAARFSCFNGGNFNDMGNPFAIPEPMGLYSRGGRLMQGTQEAFTDDGLESFGGGQPQKNEHSVGDASKDVPLSFDHGDTERSQSKNGRKHESLLRSHDEAKRGIGPSGNDSDEAEFSGARGQDVPSMLEGSDGDAFAKGLDSRKRKRSGQDTKLDLADGASQQSGESVKDDAEIRGKGDHNPTPTTSKNFGKHGKQGSQASDQAKEEYIHVRARRGQATNSHSLAERVRREKISERMKFLQDLVPGCSKVTGKAVMLDEIINYVQSLQRQVEFLSMKLATVNPRLDLNIEGLLAKNIFQTRAGSSSALGFSPDMSAACPLLLPSHERFIQAGLPGMGNSSDLLRRGNDTQLTPMSGGFKEPAQLANVWEDELHNAVRSRYGSSAALHSEGSLATGHLKSEP